MKRSALAIAVASLDVSQEAINFQGTQFFDALTTAVGQLRKAIADGPGDFLADTVEDELADIVLNVDISGIIKAYTNMSLDFFIDPADYANAWVYPRFMSKNDLFVRRLAGNSHGLKESIDDIKKLGGRGVGYVDRKSGRVHGYFEDVKSEFCVTWGLLDNKSYSDAEVAAIMLHEIGHYFTAFEYLGKYLNMSMVLQTACSQAFELETYETRAYVLVESSKLLGLKIDNVEDLAKIDDPKVRADAIQTIFMREARREQESGSNTFIYDLRICEQAADVYATRFGAARALATGMDKLLRQHDVTTMGTGTYCFLEGMKWLVSLGILIVPWRAVPALAAHSLLFGVIVTITFFASNPSELLYDRGAQRLKLIYQQLIEELKNSKTDIKRRKQLVEDADMLKAIIKEHHDRRTLFEWLQTNLLPSFSKDWKVESLQKELEALVANDLFVTAHKFHPGVKSA
jgi:hypothetical protein